MTAHLPGKNVSVSTYTQGCRCSGCRSAMRDYQRWNRAYHRGEATASESPVRKNRDRVAVDAGRSDVERIQIALARGVQSIHIMAIWGLTYEQLKAIRDAMAA